MNSLKSLLAKLWRKLGLPKNAQLLVMRFFQDQFLVGVTGVIFNDKDEVLLFKHTYRQHAWSLPGGFLKAKEHPKLGLEREIAEESGLVVSIDEQLKARTDLEAARIDLCFYGTYIGGEFQPSYEVAKHGFFSIDTLPLLRKNQLFLIDQALKQRKTKSQ